MYINLYISKNHYLEMKTAKEKESFSRFSQNLFISIYKKIEMASTRNKNTAGKISPAQATPLSSVKTK
jgi:hypothetical protein